MKNAFQDLTGKRFGRLTVLAMDHSQRRRKKWLCRCDCGTTKTIRGCNLRAGYTQSCGCFQRERAVEANTRHGGHDTAEYKTWCGIRSRCSNPNTPHFEHYGGRGIKVCERWKLFENFIADMGPRPSSKHSIERLDTDGNYEPGNCAWKTHKEQMNNTHRTVRITINGATRSLTQWCELYNQDYDLAKERIKRLGWNPLRALTTPPYHGPNYA